MCPTCWLQQQQQHLCVRVHEKDARWQMNARLCLSIGACFWGSAWILFLPGERWSSSGSGLTGVLLKVGTSWQGEALTVCGGGGGIISKGVSSHLKTGCGDWLVAEKKQRLACLALQEQPCPLTLTFPFPSL